MILAIAYALFAIACCVLAFRRHPIYALYFYLSTTYVHPPSRWWANLYLPDLRWAVLSAAICVLAVLVSRDKLNQRPPLTTSVPVIVIALYAALMWVQTLWALGIEEHVWGTEIYTKYLIAVWFVYRIADTKEAIRNVMLFHGAGCALLGVIARYYEQRDVTGRIEGVGGPGIDDANSLGMFLCVGAVIGLSLFMSQRGWRRWASLGMLAIAFVGWTMTESRGAFVGLAAGVMVLLVLLLRVRTRAALGVGLLALMMLVVIVRRDQGIVERLSTIGDVTAAKDDEEADGSARSRSVIIRAQLEMARDYPFGAGFRGTGVLSPLYLESDYLVGKGRDSNSGRSSHNTFLTALVEQGLIGAALYLALVAWVLATIVRLFGMSSRKARDPELVMLACGLCAGLVTVLVAGMATDYLIAEVQFWLIGLLVSALRIAAPPVGTAPTLQRAAAAQRDEPLDPIAARRQHGRV